MGGGRWDVEGGRRYQAVNRAGIMEETVGFAGCHLGSSLIPLVKIVMSERVEETAHQTSYMISIRWSGGRVVQAITQPPPDVFPLVSNSTGMSASSDPAVEGY